MIILEEKSYIYIYITSPMYGLFSLVVWGIKKAQIITYICMFSLKLIGTSKQIIFLCFSPHGDGVEVMVRLDEKLVAR